MSKVYDETHTYIHSLIEKNNPIILEVGAADGNDSIKFLDKYTNISLHCFEADPRAQYVHNKYVNDNRCKLHKCAVSDIDGKIKFNLSNSVGNRKLNIHTSWHNGNSDRYNVFKDATDVYNKLFNVESENQTDHGWFYSSSIQETVNSPENFWHGKYKNSIEVDTITLDTFTKNNNINHVDFLWTDVEGAETRIINGAKNTLKFTNYLMLEYSKSRTIDGKNSKIFHGELRENETIEFMKQFNFSPIKNIENNLIFKNNNI